jgi:hypothetical protein
METSGGSQRRRSEHPDRTSDSTGRPVDPGSQAEHEPELARERALVVEAAGGGDSADRGIRRRDQVNGMLEPKSLQQSARGQPHA